MDKQTLIEKKDVLKQEIEVLEQEINILQKDMRIIMDEIAKINCPYKVGDVLCGESKRKAKIVEIVAGHNDDDYRLWVKDEYTNSI